MNKSERNVPCTVCMNYKPLLGGITYKRPDSFVCKECSERKEPKTYEQGRAEMRDECLGVLEGLIESKYYRFDSSYHALRNAITKLKELK